MIGLGSVLASVSPEQKHIHLKKKSTETSDFSILRKDSIQETVTTGKRYQGDSLMHPKNVSPHKMSIPFQHKLDYKVNTNENN